MKYCRSCGCEIPEDALFCPSCGCNVQNEGAFGQTTAGQDAEYTYNGAPYSDGDKYSVMSILGFIFAFIFPVVGLILSIIAYNETKTVFSPKSRNFSKAGIIVSAVILGCEALCVIFVWIFAWSLIVSVFNAVAAAVI